MTLLHREAIRRAASEILMLLGAADGMADRKDWGGVIEWLPFLTQRAGAIQNAVVDEMRHAARRAAEKEVPDAAGG